MIREHPGYYSYKAILLDAIHGFIPVNIAEYWILQTPYLRRLHNIKQLGLSNLVFPSATHTRLNHSLGVMHIASMMADRIISEAKSSSKICAALFHRCEDNAYKAFTQLARITGLLHDIGHLPLSHMGEAALENLLDYKYSSELSRYKEVYQDLGVGKLHEVFTQFFIRDLASLAEEESKISDLELFIRLASVALMSRDTILKTLAYRNMESMAEELGLQRGAILLVNQIISNEIADADRLDYLKRDAWFTGIVYGNIDIDRLVYDLSIETEEEPYIVLGSRSIPSLEDVYDARYKMYKYVYHHHKVQSIALALSILLWYADSDPDSIRVAIIEDISSLKDILDPDTLSKYILENYTYFDDSDIERLIHKLAVSKDRVARRWANSLLHKRWLLPISLVKRPDDLAKIITEEIGLTGDSVSPDSISTCLNSLIREFSSIEEFLRDLLSKKGVRDSIYVERRIQQITSIVRDSVLNKMIRHSIYIKNIMKLGSLQLLYVYLYSMDEDQHRILWDMRSYIVNEFYDFIRDLARSRCM